MEHFPSFSPKNAGNSHHIFWFFSPKLVKKNWFRSIGWHIVHIYIYLEPNWSTSNLFGFEWPYLMGSIQKKGRLGVLSDIFQMDLRVLLETTNWIFLVQMNCLFFWPCETSHFRASGSKQGQPTPPKRTPLKNKGFIRVGWLAINDATHWIGLFLGTHLGSCWDRDVETEPFCHPIQRLWNPWNPIRFFNLEQKHEHKQP